MARRPRCAPACFGRSPTSRRTRPPGRDDGGPRGSRGAVHARRRARLRPRRRGARRCRRCRAPCATTAPPTPCSPCSTTRARACARTPARAWACSTTPRVSRRCLAVAERPSEGPLVLVSALDGLARRAERGSIPAGSPAAARAVAAACALAAPAVGEGAPAGGLFTVGDGSGNPGDGPSAEDVRATAVWALGMFADLHGSRVAARSGRVWRARSRPAVGRRATLSNPWRASTRRSRHPALRSFADGCASGADPDIARVLDRALATFGEIS